MKSRLPGFDPKLLAAIAGGAKVYELSHAMTTHSGEIILRPRWHPGLGSIPTGTGRRAL